jgi:hypothetical protein
VRRGPESKGVEINKFILYKGLYRSTWCVLVVTFSESVELFPRPVAVSLCRSALFCVFGRRADSVEPAFAVRKT